MQCEMCKEHEATVHLTQVVGSEVKKVNLCEACAAKSGLDIKGTISITDLLMGLSGGAVAAAGAGGAKPQPEETPETDRACPRCHMRRADFKKTGRLGCANCYEAFSLELAPMLHNMHRAHQHTGKIPARESKNIQASAEIAALQKALEKAIAEEQFEEAARLRDRIAAVRGKEPA
jgi:protein arginine kinase activator